SIRSAFRGFAARGTLGWERRFDQRVAVGCDEIEAVDLSQLRDRAQRVRSERRLAFEDVQQDSFEEIADGHVVIFGEALQRFEDAFLDPDSGLRALDDHRVNVPMYPDDVNFRALMLTSANNN